MQKVGFIYDDVYKKHSPPEWHPDNGDRLTHILKNIEDSGLWDRLIHIKPRKASFDDIALVHAREYIEKISHAAKGFLDMDTYFSEHTLEAALYAAGGVIEAVDRCRTGVITRAFCAVRPPGHHAEADQAMGFCIFNNVAIGSRYAQKAGFKKVFIIDFDAHHGNGTQHIFEEDGTVFYFSTHQHPYYPETGKDSERGKGKGEGFTYNVPILAGSGNKDYLFIYQDILPGLIHRTSPDIIFVSAGYDLHVLDPNADMRVTDEGIRGIVDSILHCSSVPVIFVLEGGYNMEVLGKSVSITIEEMLKS